MSDLQAVLRSHQQAVRAFVSSAGELSPAQWSEPRAEGKWSPAQIADHVAVSYEAASEVMHGRARGPAPPRVLRPLLRMLLLKPVLWLGRFPARAKAPSALRPAASPAEAPVLLERLRAAAAAFEGDVLASRSPTVDHPAFGRVRLVDLVRLQEIHTRHHRQQLPPEPLAPRVGSPA